MMNTVLNPGHKEYSMPIALLIFAPLALIFAVVAFAYGSAMSRTNAADREMLRSGRRTYAAITALLIAAMACSSLAGANQVPLNALAVLIFLGVSLACMKDSRPSKPLFAAA